MSSKNFSPNLLCGKMWPDYPAQTLDEISPELSFHFETAVISDADGLWTLNTSEWPSVDEGGLACSLAEILEPDVPQKYFLSAKACEGILRRAAKRGKELPEALRRALEQVVSVQSA